MKSTILPIAAAFALTACSTAQIPAGQENQRTFTQDSDKAYLEAYQIVARQMRACYQVIGLVGNGYYVDAKLDEKNKTASVELYHLGATTGAKKLEDSWLSRTVTIQSNGTGSMITTTGTTPKYVFMTHRAIPKWLEGQDPCDPRS